VAVNLMSLIPQTDPGGDSITHAATTRVIHEPVFDDGFGES